MHFSFEIFKTEAPEYTMLTKTPALNRRFKSLAFTPIDFSPERLQDIDRRVEKKRPETSRMYQIFFSRSQNNLKGRCRFLVRVGKPETRIFFYLAQSSLQ